MIKLKIGPDVTAIVWHLCRQ